MEDSVWSKYQGLINLILGMLLALLGWLGRTIYDEVRSLRTDHDALALKVAERYVDRDSFRNLEVKIDKILDKLDGKQDKGK